MKKIFIQIMILAGLLIPALTIANVANAQVPEPSDALKLTQEQLKQSNVELVNPILHAESASGPQGTAEITSTIWYVVDLVKYFMQAVAVIVIIAGGVMFLTAGKDSQKKIDDAKRMLTYGIMALAIITFGAMFVKKVFYGTGGAEGEVLTSQAMAESFGKEGEALIKKIYEIAEMFVGAIAILMIIINGIRIAMAFGNEEAKTKGIKRILYGLAGVLIVGIAEFAVKGILFPAHGTKLMAADKAKMLIVGLTNFASAFVAIIAFLMLIYAGYMYVFGGAEENNTQKAKKILLGAILGLILAAGAYAIVNTLIKLS
ncbi:hypothetical protein HZA39_03155 [Candidatus Peregrinibacteria bacterium]|nr:hypothetical protein [Candidatus Peregrinibacteria bacterium]